MSSEGFIPQNNGRSNCDDGPTFGKMSYSYDYIVKSITGDDDYPQEACEPWLHANAKFDNLEITGVAQGNFEGNFEGIINEQSWKGFDIKHPTKSNHRLRHICLEGPEGGIYIRGRLKNSNVIVLPDYWTNLVDPESITVTLTQIGYTQDLIVDKIEWGKNIIIKSGAGVNIDCYYVIHGSRIDGEPLVVEYVGETPQDYPGTESQYSISGYNYDVRGS